MIKHIIRCAGISLAAAASLGLLYGACIIRSASIKTLWQAGVVQISFILSSAIALVFVTPLTVWALKPAHSAKWIFPLWFVLAIYCVLVTPRSAFFGLYGTLFLAVIGLISIRVLAHR